MIINYYEIETSVLQFIRIENSVFESNTYVILLKGEPNCWVVDCGDITPLLEVFKQYNIYPSGVFITHTHFDHIYGLNNMISQYPNCSVYVSQDGRKGLYSEKLNFSHFINNDFKYCYKNITILDEGSSVKLFEDIYLNTIKTPGHDVSCLCYSVENLLFTGDSLIPYNNVITIFPKSNKTKAESSVNKLKNMCFKDTFILPGHKEPCYFNDKIFNN